MFYDLNFLESIFLNQIHRRCHSNIFYLNSVIRVIKKHVESGVVGWCLFSYGRIYLRRSIRSTETKPQKVNVNLHIHVRVCQAGCVNVVSFASHLYFAWNSFIWRLVAHFILNSRKNYNKWINHSHDKKKILSERDGTQKKNFWLVVTILKNPTT